MEPLRDERRPAVVMAVLLLGYVVVTLLAEWDRLLAVVAAGFIALAVILAIKVSMAEPSDDRGGRG